MGYSKVGIPFLEPYNDRKKTHVKAIEKEVGGKLGSHSMLAKVMLSSGLIGLIVALETHPAAAQDLRRSEVMELMSDALETYDFVETGVLPELIEEISLTALTVAESNPREYSFHSAIPLRKAVERGNYLAWNPKTHNWDLRQFYPKNLTVDGVNVMLIVKEKTKRTERSVAA